MSSWDADDDVDRPGERTERRIVQPEDEITVVSNAIEIPIGLYRRVRHAGFMGRETATSAVFAHRPSLDQEASTMLTRARDSLCLRALASPVLGRAVRAVIVLASGNASPFGEAKDGGFGAMSPVR